MAKLEELKTQQQQLIQSIERELNIENPRKAIILPG
jgi:hypothetical protein